MHSLRFILASLMLAATSFSTVAVHADEHADQLKQADQLISSGQPKAAYAVLNSVLDDYWNRIPMFVQKATFATNITGYGTYSERAPIFKVDEPHIIYVEPIGFAYKTSETGKISAGWTVNYNLTDTSGASLFQRDDFLNVDLPLGLYNREIHLTLTINLTGMKPGKYVSHYVLKDKYSEKQTKFTLPFEVVE